MPGGQNIIIHKTKSARSTPKGNINEVDITQAYSEIVVFNKSKRNSVAKELVLSLEDLNTKSSQVYLEARRGLYLPGVEDPQSYYPAEEIRNGMIYHNTTTNNLDIYIADTWTVVLTGKSLGGADRVLYVNDAVNDLDSSANFTYNDTSLTIEKLVLNGNTETLSTTTGKLKLDSATAEIQLVQYGSGARSGTATYMLAVDASGDIVEEALPTSFALTNGSGTTANGSAVDLGGTTTGAVVIDAASNNFNINRTVTGGTIQLELDSGAVQMNYNDGGGDLASVRVNRSATQAIMLVESGGNPAQFYITPTSMTIVDSINSKGVVYNADYSSNFTNRSLIDKGFADLNYQSIDGSGNVIITGNLDVQGTTTTFNTETLSVEDPLIKTGLGNTSDALDLGLYWEYSTTTWGGVFRDTSDVNKAITFFEGVQVEPDTTVNTAGAGYALADVKFGTVRSGTWEGDAITSSYIGTDAVTNDKLANMSANTLKGNSSPVTLSPQDISVSSNSLIGRGPASNLGNISIGNGLVISTNTLTLGNFSSNVTMSDPSAGSQFRIISGNGSSQTGELLVDDAEIGLIYTDFGVLDDAAIRVREANILLEHGGVSVTIDNGVIAGGRLELADGTAGAPSIFFTTSNDTGIYSEGSDDLQFAAGGAKEFEINGNGISTEGVFFMKESGSAATDISTYGQIFVDEDLGDARQGLVFVDEEGSEWPLNRSQQDTKTNIAYTLVIGDLGKTIKMNDSTTARTLTIPANSSVAFPIGTEVTVIQMGTQQVTIGITTDTLRSEGGATKLTGQYASAVLIKIATTEWILLGSITT